MQEKVGRILRAGGGLALSIVCVALTGCGEESTDAVIGAGRVIPDDGEIRWNATSKERFRLMPMGAPSTPAAAASAGSPLTWKLPPGWTAAEPPQFALAKFVSGEVQCTVTVLAGEGGGALANVNRWRKQLGQPDLAPEDLDRLERVPMLGTGALLVEIENEAQFLLGTVCQLEDAAVFVKMSGPPDGLERERGAFRAFCESLALKEAG